MTYHVEEITLFVGTREQAALAASYFHRLRFDSLAFL